MATWTISKKLNVSPYAAPLVIQIKQYTSDFALKLQLYSTVGDLDIPAGATTKIRGTKRDGNGYELTGTRIGHTCTFSGTKEQMQQMTAAHGRCVFEVVVEHDGKELITANFYLEVQRAAMDAGTVTSESIIEEFADFQSKITAAQAAATAAQEQADRAEAAAESIDFGIDPAPTQGSTNAVSSGAVWQLNEQLIDELSRTYTNPFEPTFNIMTGGVGTSGANYSNHPERARTQYIPVEAGKTYLVHLNITDYSFHNAWLYTTNADAGASRSITLLNNQNLIFTADENENYFRVGFKNSVDDTLEITEENRTTIHDALNFYTSGVYEQIENIHDEIDNTNTKITDEISRTYTKSYTPTFDMFPNGITLTGGNYNSHPERARTAYIPVEAGKTYLVHLDISDYTFHLPWLYTTDNYTTATRRIELLNNQNLIFTADENENYFRVGFKNSVDDTLEITEENRTTIHDALNFYTSDTDEIKEDVKSHADYINGLIDYPTINWKAFPQTTSDAYVLSWCSGFWGNSNTANNSTTAGAIRYWSWIGKQMEAIRTNYVEFIPPAEGHIILKEFESETATELINRYEIAEPTVIKLHDTHIYRIYILGLTGEISDYLTEEFINSIGIRPIYSVKDTNKAIRTGEFIRFTVKVNNTWSHTTETDTADYEGGEEHDHLCILTLPESYKTNGAKTPLIMYCHGASCGITANSWYGNGTGEGTAGNFLSMVRAFTAQGYAIFDVNNTRQVSRGFYDWGCLPLMSAYIKAWEYIKEKYNVSDKLYLLSASMGTPVALNMMKWYKGDILASLILAPRPVSGNGRWSSTYEVSSDKKIKEILVSWGFEPDSILEDETYVLPSKESVFTAEVDAKLRGFYHYENMMTIDGTDYIFEKFPPTKVMVGTSDTDFLTEVREYFSALQNFGNYINYREVAGQSHGEMCTLVNGDLRSEGLAWFERFRYAEPTEEETT